LRNTKEGALVVLGGAIIFSYGFIGLSASDYLTNLTQLATGDYLRLWALTFLVIISGFILILAGFLIASTGRWKTLIGGALGVIGSVMGGILTIGLLLTVLGIGQNVTGGLNQTYLFSIASQLLFFGSFPAMFVGFPLSMYGSAAGIMKEREKMTDATEPST
jgi:hypothetical protein